MATRLVASEIDLTAGPTRASMLSMDAQERELDALIGLYLLRCEAEGKSPETQRAYRESLQRFCRFVHLVNGPRDVHELTPRLIYPWGGKMSRGPLVLVMEAAQDGSALHSAKSRPPLR